MDPLNAISPIDGRYLSKTSELSPYFSEFGLMHYRVKVEIAYFLALYELGIERIKGIPHSSIKEIERIEDNFTQADAKRIKEIESVTNHDVKAVEYFIKEKLEALGLDEYSEMIHFGLTSQDINNTAVPLSFKHALEEIYLPGIRELLNTLHELAERWKEIPMLARTHGQPASPTTLGKEIFVFHYRLERQLELLVDLPFEAKFGGATGNFNAHYAAYPKVDWIDFANDLLNNKMGLERLAYTTQITHYDGLAAHFHCLSRINTILIDMARDIWHYISIEYFKQKVIAGEVGSSAMPHKVNPIDFENAEGNLGYANAIYYFLAEKLPVSRLQRDLTDSTVLRNIGVPVAHSLIALKSLKKGLNKLELNEVALKRDLENNWAVIAEAIQNILRRENFPKPYEALKELTRGESGISKTDIHNFIRGLDIGEAIKEEMLKITPFNYIGNAAQII